MVDRQNRQTKFVYNSKQQRAARILADPRHKYIKFYGSSRSGKTLLVLRFIRVRALKYAQSKHLVARYSFANAKKTIWLFSMLPLFKQDEKLGLCKINLSEGVVQYFNGSLIVLGGLEPTRIDSILAAEYGTIFVTEANENKWREIELLFSRMNDTAKSTDGQQIEPKAIFDLNPTTMRSWDYILWNLGQNPESGEPVHNPSEYTYLQFRSEDNESNLSRNYIDTLKNLSPAKKKRFYEGEYGSSEGLIFSEFDPEKHLVNPFAIPAVWPKYRGIDFGYVHPTACLWAAYDSANETVYIYREYRRGNLTSQEQARRITEISRADLPHSDRRQDSSAVNSLYTTVTDHQSEYRAGFEAEGIFTLTANKNVAEGLDLTKEMFDKIKIKIFRDCSMLIDEIYAYIKDPKSEKLAPIKTDDDLVDALRYIIMQIYKHRSNIIIRGVILT